MLPARLHHRLRAPRAAQARRAPSTGCRPARCASRAKSAWPARCASRTYAWHSATPETCDTGEDCRDGLCQSCGRDEECAGAGTCDPVSGLCRTSCNLDTECKDGNHCDAAAQACAPVLGDDATCERASQCGTGNCLAGACCPAGCDTSCSAGVCLGALGHACDSDADWESGAACADHVCCSSHYDGACESCATNDDGQCELVLEGLDLDSCATACGAAGCLAPDATRPCGRSRLAASRRARRACATRTANASGPHLLADIASESGAPKPYLRLKSGVVVFAAPSPAATEPMLWVLPADPANTHPIAGTEGLSDTHLLLDDRGERVFFVRDHQPYATDGLTVEGPYLWQPLAPRRVVHAGANVLLEGYSTDNARFEPWQGSPGVMSLAASYTGSAGASGTVYSTESDIFPVDDVAYFAGASSAHGRKLFRLAADGTLYHHRSDLERGGRKPGGGGHARRRLVLRRHLDGAAPSSIATRPGSRPRRSSGMCARPPAAPVCAPRPSPCRAPTSCSSVAARQRAAPVTCGFSAASTKAVAAGATPPALARILGAGTDQLYFVGGRPRPGKSSGAPRR